MASSVQINFPDRPLGFSNTVADIATLRALDPSGSTEAINVLVPGSGWYSWKPASLATDNGASVIKPDDRTNLQTGRWHIAPIAFVEGAGQGAPGPPGPAGDMAAHYKVKTPYMFGAVGHTDIPFFEGTNTHPPDDSDALIAFFRDAAIPGNGAKYIYDWSGQWAVSKTIPVAFPPILPKASGGVGSMDAFNPATTFICGQLRVLPLHMLKNADDSPRGEALDVVLDVAAPYTRWIGPLSIHPTGQGLDNSNGVKYANRWDDRRFWMGMRRRFCSQSDWQSIWIDDTKRDLVHDNSNGDFTLDGHYYSNSGNIGMRGGSITGRYFGSCQTASTVYGKTSALVSATAGGNVGSLTGRETYESVADAANGRVVQGTNSLEHVLVPGSTFTINGQTVTVPEAPAGQTGAGAYQLLPLIEALDIPGLTPFSQSIQFAPGQLSWGLSFYWNNGATLTLADTSGNTLATLGLPTGTLAGTVYSLNYTGSISQRSLIKTSGMDSPGLAATFTVSPLFDPLYTGHLGNGLRDGKYTTPASYTATDIPETGLASVRADLGSAVLVTRVDLAPIPTSAGWGPAYLNGNKLQYSTDDIAWTDAVTLSDHADHAAKEYALNITARYWRVVGGEDYIGISEFRFYSGNDTGEGFGAASDIEPGDMFRARHEIPGGDEGYGTATFDAAASTITFSAGDFTHAVTGVQVEDTYYFLGGPNQYKSFEIVEMSGTNGRTWKVHPAPVNGSTSEMLVSEYKYCTAMQVLSPTTFSCYPRLPTRINSTLQWIFGAIVRAEGSDSANVQYDALNGIMCPIGLWSDGLYGPLVRSLKMDHGEIFIRMGRGGANSSMLSTKVIHGHDEATLFSVFNQAGGSYLEAETVDPAKAYSDQPTFGANDFRPANASMNHSYQFIGRRYEGGSQGSYEGISLPKHTANNAEPRTYIHANSATLEVDYNRKLARYLAKNHVMEAWWTGPAGAAPTGTLTINLAPEWIAKGYTFAGALTGTSANIATPGANVVLKIAVLDAAKKFTVIRTNGA